MNTKLLFPLLVVAGAIYMLTRSKESYVVVQPAMNKQPAIFAKVVNGKVLSGPSDTLYVQNAAGQYVPFA